MAPQREVDHTIELVHGVTLIAKAPYIHSFKKNVLLETQLQDLLKKKGGGGTLDLTNLYGILQYLKKKW